MSTPQTTATITANGSTYSAWESVMVRRDYGNAISVFEFTPIEGAYGDSNSQLRLKPGDNVTIALGGQTALTGRVTTRTVSYDAKSHQIVIAGRSITADLKESSVPIKQGNYNGYTFQQAAQAVLQNHGINLLIQNAGDAASTPFARLLPQYGETCAEFIGRLAAQRGLYLSDDPQGNLVASRMNQSSDTVDTLTEGQNILRAVCKMDNQNMANGYTGVAQSPGSDSAWPSRAHSATVTNTGSYLNGNVQKLFIAEHPASSSNELTTRVQHEAEVSELPAFTASITVQGWLTSGGQLWDPLMKVNLVSPLLFWGQQTQVACGIQSVTFQQDSQAGTTTTLELRLPNLLSETAYSGADPAPAAPSTFGGTNPGKAAPDQPDYTIST